MFCLEKLSSDGGSRGFSNSLIASVPQTKLMFVMYI